MSILTSKVPDILILCKNKFGEYDVSKIMLDCEHNTYFIIGLGDEAIRVSKVKKGVHSSFALPRLGDLYFR